MQPIRLALALVFLLAAACSMRSAIETLTSPEDRAFAQEMVTRLRSGDEAWLQRHFDPALWAAMWIATFALSSSAAADEKAEAIGQGVRLGTAFARGQNLARTLGNLVRATTAEAGFRNPDTLSNVAKTAVWIFAVIIAVNQVGIAETLVNTLFTGAVAALSLAAGLAFGLGGRDLAARKLDDWYEDGDEGTPKLK